MKHRLSVRQKRRFQANKQMKVVHAFIEESKYMLDVIISLRAQIKSLEKTGLKLSPSQMLQISNVVMAATCLLKYEDDRVNPSHQSVYEDLRSDIKATISALGITDLPLAAFRDLRLDTARLPHMVQ